MTSAQRALIRIDPQEDFQITDLQNCVALVLSSLLSNALRAIKDQTIHRMSAASLLPPLKKGE